jgi:hypothetical protein
MNLKQVPAWIAGLVFSSLAGEPVTQGCVAALLTLGCIRSPLRGYGMVAGGYAVTTISYFLYSPTTGTFL